MRKVVIGGLMLLLVCDAKSQDCINSYEPNGTAATAAVIPKNTTITAAIANSADADYYKFTTTSYGDFTINLFNLNLPSTYYLWLVDNTGAYIYASTPIDGAPYKITMYNQPAGTYYIKVFNYSNNPYHPLGCYDLNVITIPNANCTNAYEPNNTVATATVIPLTTNSGNLTNMGFDTTIAAGISASSDVDYYKFTVPSIPYTFSVTLHTLDTGVDVSLVNSTNTTLATSNSAGTGIKTISYQSSSSSSNIFYAKVANPKGAGCYTVQFNGNCICRISPGNNPGNTFPNLITLYPNPVVNTVQVNLLKGIDRRSDATIQIINARGIVILEQKINSNPQAIDVSKLPQGFYLVKANTGTATTSARFVKE